MRALYLYTATASSIFFDVGFESDVDSIVEWVLIGGKPVGETNFKLGHWSQYPSTLGAWRKHASHASRSFFGNYIKVVLHTSTVSLSQSNPLKSTGPWDLPKNSERTGP